MPQASAQLLRDYLEAVRRVHLRRGVAALTVEVLAVATTLSLAGIAAVGHSLRGDLGATTLPILALACIGALVTGRARALHRRLRSSLAVARGVAKTRGDLRQAATTGERERDAILRHEILGATELWQLEPVTSGASADWTERSPELAAAYVRRIGAATLDLDPRLALPLPRLLPRCLAALLLLAGLAGLLATDLGDRGVALLRAGEDGRPPPPPQPVWSSLELELDYPAHTRRPARRVQNPSGSLRMPAGTRVQLDMIVDQPADAVRLVLMHDGAELASAPAPELVDFERIADAGEHGGRWTGSFVARGSGSWVVALLDDADDPGDPASLRVAARRSAPMAIELEVDAPPEVELLPLPASRREASETDRVELRFSARDDFGVVGAELVYELGPVGEQRRLRLPAGKAPGGAARNWRHRYTWDLSAIPLDERGEVSYWIEVRDNDPGLGLQPLVDGPGKLAASARQQLLVHDDEAEHAENIRDLQEIRDSAVDLLAARLTTAAFTDLEAIREQPPALRRKLGDARDLHEGAAALLTMIAGAVDALAVDTMVNERDIASLAAIHERLLAIHRDEAALHETLAPGAEFEDGAPIPALLGKLGKHNRREIEQLEDEIIRLDDLVDGQIIARLEALIARLQVSQQKLVEKLEQLAAGDETVRPAIEQLEQRIREDMRRVQEARAALRKEVGDEWMNLDALRAMEARMRSEALLEQLRRGDVEGALQQAREGLDAIRQMRERVQQSGSNEPTPALSEEDQKRMKMLRELSRLQDEQTGLRGETRRLRERWRDLVGEQKADAEAAEQAKREAGRLREQLETINDARLSREGRAAWEDAREALQTLEAATDDPAGASALSLFEAAQQAAADLERAAAGSDRDEAEGKALRQLARDAARLRQQLRTPLPDPDEVLEAEDAQALGELGQRQRTLRDRAGELLDDPAADILPDPGRAAMQTSDQAMGEAGDALDDAALDGALDGEQRAWDGLQRAIDSLRQSAPPPPPAAGGEASTEAERDRSLRDQVVEAMREGDRDGFGEDTKRYYEELLR